MQIVARRKGYYRPTVLDADHTEFKVLEEMQWKLGGALITHHWALPLEA